MWRVGGSEEGEVGEWGGRGALTVWELIRTIDVVGADDDGLERVAMSKCSHEHLGGCFATAVGVQWFQCFLFAMAFRPRVRRAVGLVGGHLNELFDAARFGALQEDLGAYDVGGSERGWVLEARIDV